MFDHSLTVASQIYVGEISHEDIKEKVESAKLILSVGGLKSDFNTGNFTYHIPTQRTVEVSVPHLSRLPLCLQRSRSWASSSTPTTPACNSPCSQASA